MKKNKKCQDGLLSPDTFWEKKLEINFANELARYKKLCGSISKKEVHLLDGKYYITYHDWKEHIEILLDKLTDAETEEFYHYLKNKERMSTILNNTTSSIIIPYIIAFFAPFIVEEIFTFLTPGLNISIAMIVATLLISVMCFVTLKNILKDTKKDSITTFFYIDIQAIIIKKHPFLAENHS